MPEIPINDSTGIFENTDSTTTNLVSDSIGIQNHIQLNTQIFLDLLRDSEVMFQNSHYNIRIEIDPNLEILYYPEDRPPSPYVDDDNIIYYDEEELFPNPGDLEEYSLLQPLLPVPQIPDNLLSNYNFPNNIVNIYEPSMGPIYSNFQESNFFPNYDSHTLPDSSSLNIETNDEFNTLMSHDNLYAVLLNAINILGDIIENTPPENIENETLTSIQIEQIPCKEYDKISNENVFKSKKCIICYEEYQSTDLCRILTCKHIFHKTCIDKWLLENSNKCPLCKKIV